MGPLAGSLLLMAGITVTLLAQTSRPTFEVASVKPSTATFLVITPQRTPGRITWQTDLWGLLSYAYNMPTWRISGPIPDSDHIYNVDAKADPSATEDQVRLMMRSLLEDRFQMSTHIISKETNGYVLTVAKGGPKMLEAKDGAAEPSLPEWFRNKSIKPGDLDGKVVATIESKAIGNITGRNASMPQLCAFLERILQTFVLDETGVRGNYYFDLRFARDDAPEDTDLPKLAGALRGELGLTLERKKGPIEMLVVDHIESVPTGN